ncbi:RsmG family class I SAM-dependent methyltransferase [Bacteriovorax sp. PP10]|uniref:Ribosomal RNA small subunit methyltransferase G n=1 Tax=Bacteriovorax antarcticus TaxID=3088717 RepID=A0ABU5VP27_9BACT|nr:RsmG family class I SAM-dependent methyltransferase [Bacteriovorax sp. PP10]MEA9354798.1 RsmG family class I SAM-dependent methyltransferase [Bacteriovorax sp. PP10]
MKEFAKKYLDLLTGEFAGINLTRIESPEDFYNKQILDSVMPMTESKVFRNALETTKLVVDVGFGGGFPILPLAFKNPDVKFIGMEARAKKAQVVQSIANSLGLTNATLKHQRLDFVDFDVDTVITFKAVGKVIDFLPMIRTDKTVYVFFYKGPNFYELEDIEELLEKNWELIEEKSYDVPGTEGRVLLGFKNRKVLRGTLVTEKIIKFSSLL